MLGQGGGHGRTGQIEARHEAIVRARSMGVAIEFWHMPDPSLVEGSREVRLEAYRGLRDELMRRMEKRFARGGVADV